LIQKEPTAPTPVLPVVPLRSLESDIEVNLLDELARRMQIPGGRQEREKWDDPAETHNKFWRSPKEMIDYLRFYVPLKNFSFIWRRHLCR
jgi:hypothetical protein